METQTSQPIHKPTSLNARFARELFPKFTMYTKHYVTFAVVGITWIGLYQVALLVHSELLARVAFIAGVLTAAIVFFYGGIHFLTSISRQYKKTVLRSEKGADFEVVFQKTTRFRYQVTRTGLVYEGKTTNNNVDCSKLLYVTLGGEPFCWVFVECKKPAKGDLYIQVIPYLLFSEKNKFEFGRDAVFEGSNATYFANERRDDEHYQFKLILPNAFYRSEVSLFVLACPLFSQGIVPRRETQVEKEEHIDNVGGLNSIEQPGKRPLSQGPFPYLAISRTILTKTPLIR